MISWLIGLITLFCLHEQWDKMNEQKRNNIGFAIALWLLLGIFEFAFEYPLITTYLKMKG